MFQNPLVHTLFESASYIVGIQLYYRNVRSAKTSSITETQRICLFISVILGAILGAHFLGVWEHWQLLSPYSSNPFHLFFLAKTIVGGLLGGWIGIEIVKYYLGIKESTGDNYILPILLGIAIGRIGCFFYGVADGTWGSVTTVPWAMDGGDQLLRHPLPLYEILFLSCLLALLSLIKKRITLPQGTLFRLGLFAYVLYRFCIEFLKDRELTIFGILSPIQLVCFLAFLIIGVHTYFFYKKHNAK